jgi:hypothetical protein
VRNGGAWGGRSDGLTGAYSCDGESSFILVSDVSPAVDKSADIWTVQVGDLKDPNSVLPPPTTVDVVKAYFADSTDSSGDPAEPAAADADTAADPQDYHSLAWAKGQPMQAQSTNYAIYFGTPSGNIHCTMGSDDWPVMCKIESKDFADAPKPAGCQQTWETDIVALGKDGAVSGFCTGGVLVPQVAAELPYGSSLTFGGHICSSAETGVTCSDSAGTSGFTLNRAGFVSH